MSISRQSAVNRVSNLYVEEGDFVEENALLLKLEGYKKAEIERKEEESELEAKNNNSKRNGNKRKQRITLYS